MSEEKEYNWGEGDVVEEHELGSFEMASTVARVTDPCYARGTWCSGSVDNVKSGKFNVDIEKRDFGDWGIRCATLTAIHECVGHEAELKWKDQGFEVGVDSGQAGIFDDKFYQEDLEEPHKCTGRLEYEAGRGVDPCRTLSSHLMLETLRLREDDISIDEKLTILNAMAIQVDRCKDELLATTDYAGAPETTDFYEACSDLTFSNIGAGTLPHGACSRSGDGDGGYLCRVARDPEGMAVAIQIDFYPHRGEGCDS